MFVIFFEPGYVSSNPCESQWKKYITTWPLTSYPDDVRFARWSKSVDCFFNQSTIMGYSEHICQLCGVSFAIARLRRADEPIEAAWDSSGVLLPQAEDMESSDECSAIDGEHIAGIECISTQGYSGHRISVEEMKVWTNWCLPRLFIWCFVKCALSWSESSVGWKERFANWNHEFWASGTPLGLSFYRWTARSRHILMLGKFVRLALWLFNDSYNEPSVPSNNTC